MKGKAPKTLNRWHMSRIFRACHNQSRFRLFMSMRELHKCPCRSRKKRVGMWIDKPTIGRVMP